MSTSLARVLLLLLPGVRHACGICSHRLNSIYPPSPLHCYMVGRLGRNVAYLQDCLGYLGGVPFLLNQALLNVTREQLRIFLGTLGYLEKEIRTRCQPVVRTYAECYHAHSSLAATWQLHVCSVKGLTRWVPNAPWQPAIACTQFFFARKPVETSGRTKGIPTLSSLPKRCPINTKDRTHNNAPVDGNKAAVAWLHNRCHSVVIGG